MSLHDPLENHDNRIVTRSRMKTAQGHSSEAGSSVVEARPKGSNRASSTPKNARRTVARQTRQAAGEDGMKSNSEVNEKDHRVFRESPVKQQSQQQFYLPKPLGYGELRTSRSLQGDHRQILDILEALRVEFLQMKAKLNLLAEQERTCCQVARMSCAVCGTVPGAEGTQLRNGRAARAKDSAFVSDHLATYGASATPMENKSAWQQPFSAAVGMSTPRKHKRIMQLGATETRPQRSFSFTRQLTARIGKRKKNADCQVEAKLAQPKLSREDLTDKASELTSESPTSPSASECQRPPMSGASNAAHHKSRPTTAVGDSARRSSNVQPSHRLVSTSEALLDEHHQGHVAQGVRGNGSPPALPPRSSRTKLSTSSGLSGSVHRSFPAHPVLTLESEYATMQGSGGTLRTFTKSVSDANIDCSPGPYPEPRPRSVSLCQASKRGTQKSAKSPLYHLITAMTQQPIPKPNYTSRGYRLVHTASLPLSSSRSGYDHVDRRFDLQPVPPVATPVDQPVQQSKDSQSSEPERNGSRCPTSQPSSDSSNLAEDSSSQCSNYDRVDQQSTESDADSPVYSLTADGQALPGPYTTSPVSVASAADTRDHFRAMLLRICNKQMVTEGKDSADALELMRTAAELGFLARKPDMAKVAIPTVGSDIIYDEDLLSSTSDDGDDNDLYYPPSKRQRTDHVYYECEKMRPDLASCSSCADASLAGDKEPTYISAASLQGLTLARQSRSASIASAGPTHSADLRAAKAKTQRWLASSSPCAVNKENVMLLQPGYEGGQCTSRRFPSASTLTTRPPLYQSWHTKSAQVRKRALSDALPRYNDNAVLYHQ